MRRCHAIMHVVVDVAPFGRCRTVDVWDASVFAKSELPATVPQVPVP
jgi:hypothetical protein